MIEFIINNEIVQTEKKSGMTLLNFIREVKGLKGTKSGCKEGDCGACTVLIGTLQDDKTISYRSVTSCLTPLANVANKHIVTVEGLNLSEKLNIAQLVIKENHGTQCGFCTPGVVVSLTGYALDKHINAKPVDHLSGNICRCTGYKSIEKAANTIEEILKEKDINNDLHWLIDNKFIPEYFSTIEKKLRDLNSATKVRGKQLVGGGTDLYVGFAGELNEKDVTATKDYLSNQIVFEHADCAIGANTNVSDILENESFNRHFPNLQNHLKLVSSKQIRNMGTIAGNFVNASPIGDMSIFFLALDSKLELKNIEDKSRTIFLKDFFKDYKKFDLREGEIITKISFRLPKNKFYYNFEKVSKRTHLDIASVNSAIMIGIENGVMKDVNISIGGVSAIPKYLFNTSKFLTGSELSTQNIVEAQKIMQKEIAPISDVRGTIRYKRLLARQLFFAHFIELFPDKFNLGDLILNK